MGIFLVCAARLGSIINRLPNRRKIQERNKFKKKSGVVHFNNEQNEELEFNSDWMCFVSSADSRRRPPYIQRVDINGTVIDMHIDTGNPVSLLT